MITNGTFNTDLSGWTYSGGVSWDNGRALLQTDSTNQIPYMYQSFVIDNNTISFDYDTNTNFGTGLTNSFPIYELIISGNVISSGNIPIYNGQHRTGTVIIDVSTHMGETATLRFRWTQWCGDNCVIQLWTDNVNNYNTYGYVSFTSIPSGARIFIDNIDQGINTPSTVSYLVAGTHSYRLVFGGYPDKTGNFTIILGQTVGITGTFTPITGIANGTFDANLAGWTTSGNVVWDNTWHPGDVLLRQSGSTNAVISQNFVINGNTVAFDYQTYTEPGHGTSWPPYCQILIGGTVVKESQIPNWNYAYRSGTSTIDVSAYINQTATVLFQWKNLCGASDCTVSLWVDNVATTNIVLGNASFSSTPSGARIFIDNVDKGVNTPFVITNLSTGNHSYKYTQTGYYDKTGSFSITAGQTTNVVDTLSPVTGSISFSSTPSGARIFINNVDRGVNTPNTISNLNPGTYNIKLTLNNYYDWTGTATVTSGQTTTVSSTLVPLPGNLSISSIPLGARILIDNVDQGVNTPNIITSITPGSHSLTLRHTNYNDYTIPVTIISNQTVTVTPTPVLTLASGIIKIEASPSFTRSSYTGEIIDLGTIKIDWNGTGTIILENTIVYDRLVLTGPNGVFDHTWSPCGSQQPEGPFDITNIFLSGYNEINVKIYNVCGLDIGTIGGSIDITGPITLACPITPKYSGNTVTLQATPKDGIGPYYVEFRKNTTIIDPSRLGGLDNPIYNATEDVQITRIYSLDDVDIASALSGTIDFEVFISDSCPTGAKTCDQVCTIDIGCIAPVCNFTVT